MLGFSSIAASPLSAILSQMALPPIEPPDNPPSGDGIIASTIPSSRTVVFGGSIRVVSFPGSIRKVEF